MARMTAEAQGSLPAAFCRPDFPINPACLDLGLPGGWILPLAMEGWMVSAIQHLSKLVPTAPHPTPALGEHPPLELTFHSKPATAKPPAAPEPASPMKRPEPSLLAKREAPIWRRERGGASIRPPLHAFHHLPLHRHSGTPDDLGPISPSLAQPGGDPGCEEDTGRDGRDADAG